MWRTFNNRRIPIVLLTHQHLSNILWFYELVMEDTISVHNAIEAELVRRFGNLRLPYQPVISFGYEMEMLERKGYISNRVDSEVVVNGQRVGKISSQLN